MKFDYYKPIEQQITIQDYFENMINQNLTGIRGGIRL